MEVFSRAFWKAIMFHKITPDKQKAKALLKMAEITLERLEKTELERYPSNSLVDYYEIIHKLLEAIAFQEGIKIKGEGAHQELIDFIAKEYQLGEQARQFLQQLRDYRNKISYEGFMIHKQYISMNQKRIKAIIIKLKKIQHTSN